MNDKNKRNCVTHHHACDCREERFKRIKKERDELAEVVLHLSQGHCEPRRLTKGIELAKRIKEKSDE